MEPTITEIELQKWYRPDPNGRAIRFWSESSTGMINYETEGVKSMLPRFCTRQKALDIVNGVEKVWL